MNLSNEPWGFAIGLGVGSILGSIGSYFLFNKIKNKEKMDEIAEIEAYYMAKLKESWAKKDDVSGGVGGEKEVGLDPQKVPIDALDKDGNPKDIFKFHPQLKEENYTKYDKMAKVNGKKIEVCDTREEIKFDPYPHEITLDQFRGDLNFAKHTLIYYEQSNVFVTVGDELTDYTEDYFGLRNINDFGRNGKWTLYLRDDMTKDDFELIYDGTSTWEEVELNSGGAK